MLQPSSGRNGIRNEFFFPIKMSVERCVLVLLLRFVKSENKVSLQTSLERNPSNLSYIFFSDVNFKNLTVEFHVPYVLNMYIKFRSNRILFIIWSMNVFFIHNFRLQKLEILTFVWWHSNWSLIFLKFCKHKGYNKNMQSNG